MLKISKIEIDGFKKVIESHPNLRDYFKKNGLKGFCRFWNLLRTDLSRKQPEEVEEYLNTIDQKTRLSELPSKSQLDTSGSTLGQDLAKQYVKNIKDKNRSIELRNRQAALIQACLEMEASCRLETSDSKIVTQEKKDQLKRRLLLWDLP